MSLLCFQMMEGRLRSGKRIHRTSSPEHTGMHHQTLQGKRRRLAVGSWHRIVQTLLLCVQIVLACGNVVKYVDKRYGKYLDKDVCPFQACVNMIM